MSPPFLAQFPDFRWDPTAPLLENFGRLADQEGWSKKSKTYKRMRRDFLAEGVLIGFLDQPYRAGIGSSLPFTTSKLLR